MQAAGITGSWAPGGSGGVLPKGERRPSQWRVTARLEGLAGQRASPSFQLSTADQVPEGDWQE